MKAVTLALSTLALSTWLPTGVHALTGERQTPLLKQEIKAVIAGNNVFALEMFKQLRQPDTNAFIAPLGIADALALMFAGARAETAAQMARTLHFTLDSAQLSPAFASLRQMLVGAPGRQRSVLRLANRLWGQQGDDYSPRFLSTARKYHGAGLQQLDFMHGKETARNTINAWVAAQTEHKIQEAVPALSSETRLVLTNTVYFKAPWQSPFAAAQTRSEDFSLADGSKVQTALMHQRLNARYFKGADFAALELPYGAGELSMIVLLPDRADGLPALEENLNIADLQHWIDGLRKFDVEVSLPKFKLASKTELQPLLGQMGMPYAFDAGKADFGGMTSTRRLYLAYANQNAFIEVNEAGTEAAAATVVTAVAVSAPAGHASFRADHPCVYLIRHAASGSILFIGRLLKPA